jgi:hypothetical protein
MDACVGMKVGERVQSPRLDNERVISKNENSSRAPGWGRKDILQPHSEVSGLATGICQHYNRVEAEWYGGLSAGSLYARCTLVSLVIGCE